MTTSTPPTKREAVERTIAELPRPLSLAGVPDYIAAADIVVMIESLGLDPDDVFALQFEPEAVRATVLAKGPNGKPFMTGSRDEQGDLVLAMHKVSIPIRRDDEATPARVTLVTSNHERDES